MSTGREVIGARHHPILVQVIMAKIFSFFFFFLLEDDISC